jgi:phosphohistidine phosphatase SixA
VVFVLVRHAHAGSKRRWPGADEERPLSRRGQSQALEVARLLHEVGVTRLLSSPTTRCRQSLVPASEALWVPIEPTDVLAVDAPIELLGELLTSPEVDGAALCTHGETLRALSQAWAPSWREAAGPPPPPDLSGTPKGGCWLVEHYGTARASARFLGNGAR